MTAEIQPSPPEPLQLPARFNIADHFILPNLEPERAGRPYLRLAGAGEAVEAGTLTFDGLHRRANRFANALVRLGLRPGERIALLMRESLDFPVCFWGAVRAGVIPVPLNTQLPPGDYAHFLADSAAAALVVDAALWPLVKDTLRDARRFPSLPRLKQIIAAGESQHGEAFEAPSLAELMHGEAEEFESVLAAPGDPAFWLYTSGSTGRPKPAVHRQGDMAFVATHYLKRVLKLRPDDVAFSAPKMFFAYGLGNSLYFPLVSGSSAIILTGPATAEACYGVLAHHRPTVFYAVPSLFSAMLDHYEAGLDGPPHPRPIDDPKTEPPGKEKGSLENPGFEPPGFENLRLVLSGGEVLPAGLFHRWRRHFGTPILDGLGSTEALHFYLSNTPAAHRPGSAGRIVPGYQARLVDTLGQESPPGEAGELWLRGGSLASAGTHRNAAPQKELAPEEWLATGDRLRRDGEGFYYYEGRTDDMIKVAGAWVSPAEVEAVLASHPAVTDCAVTGYTAFDGLTRIAAHVVLHTVPPPSVDDPQAELAALLMAHMARRLPPFKIPAKILFPTSLPKTPSGKTRRFLLRQQNPGAPTTAPKTGIPGGPGTSA